MASSAHYLSTPSPLWPGLGGKLLKTQCNYFLAATERGYPAELSNTYLGEDKSQTILFCQTWAD